MRKNNSKRLFILLLIISIFAGVLTGGGISYKTQAKNRVETARPSVNGRLHVKRNKLVDEEGNVVQLRGVSTHGLTWYPDFINERLFKQLSEEWDCSFIRLAMYSETYCEEPVEEDGKNESLRLMEKGIEAAIAADMYVLVDWHILNDYDPNINSKQAREFFDYISKKYADYPNLLFEICNEPNGATSWNDITMYANETIPVIRKNIPDSVIMVGTPNYDRVLTVAMQRPLDFDNVMYSFHFYAASHREDLKNELEVAVQSGLPVFITECGLTEESGDGTINFDSAREWFGYLAEKKIGYAVWSLSDKDESSAFFMPNTNPDKEITWNELTETGKWVKSLIQGVEPTMIPAHVHYIEKTRLAKVRSFIRKSLGAIGMQVVTTYELYAALSLLVVLIILILRQTYIASFKNKNHTYYDVLNVKEQKAYAKKSGVSYALAKTVLVASSYFTTVYLSWRIVFSIPRDSGIIPVIANIVLLVVEVFGFIESLVLYENLLGMKNHPLPHIEDDEFPEVDIFIATYNEPEELLRKTINGCNHLSYPDKSKVHVWVCDDNRRASMRALAEQMGVGYFDRPDNKGAKAGNLNHALANTSAPYIVTLDADMIVKSDFLLKTIPYFVDTEKRGENVDEKDRIHLGLLQTPQCFYDPDVFQHALYSERRAPDEQDFCYRTIGVAKTSTNSVIYGGSNTVLSRKALEDVGGFYTESITEDFATGLLIESAGYVSLALSEPLASGQTPHTYKEHIQQRTRWGRGVIVTARKLGIWRRKNLSLRQKISYWSSVAYWYSPIKHLVYLMSPLLFAAFAVPVLRCTWVELFIYWLPMFIFQDLALRLISGNLISLKWSGIYETSVMPHLLIPIIKESLGITLKTFKVTDKSGKGGKRKTDTRSMIPFIILIVLSVIGIIRVICIMDAMRMIALFMLLFWIIRNLYYLIMALFLIDGRDSDSEVVDVIDAEPVVVQIAHGEGKGKLYEGVTTKLTEHNFGVYLDGGERLNNGTPVKVTIDTGEYKAKLEGAVTNVHESKKGGVYTHTIEILDFGTDELEYLEILYDRIPSLPQSLTRDFGIMNHLWQNIAHRVARTRKY